MLRKFDTDNKELERKCIDEVIARIEEMGGDTPGQIAAQDIIGIVTQNYGPEIYNKALNDAKKLLETKLNDLSTDLDLLEQQ
jgi:uncharacterized protein (DUF2164 family)